MTDMRAERLAELGYVPVGVDFDFKRAHRVDVYWWHRNADLYAVTRHHGTACYADLKPGMQISLFPCYDGEPISVGEMVALRLPCLEGWFASQHVSPWAILEDGTSGTAIR